MRYCLHKNQNDKSRLLLFFNGWGMDSVGNISNFLACWQKILAAVGYGECFKGELFELYDYTEPGLDIDLAELTREYDQIVTLAWSLGVWASAERLSEYNISPARAVAVNGTLKPISSDYGLSPEIFRATADNWIDESARSSFNRRMCRGRNNLASFEQLQRQRPLLQQRQELVALGERIKSLDLDCVQIYDLAVVSSQDKIFLPDRQQRYWNKHKVEIIPIDTPHWPGPGIKER